MGGKKEKESLPLKTHSLRIIRIVQISLVLGFIEKKIRGEKN
jgi:hypothetical protein